MGKTLGTVKCLIFSGWEHRLSASYIAGGMAFTHIPSSFFFLKNSLSVFLPWESKALTDREWVGSQGQSGHIVPWGIVQPSCGHHEALGQ